LALRRGSNSSALPEPVKGAAARLASLGPAGPPLTAWNALGLTETGFVGLFK
jgi:hypothetical protein